MFEFEFKDGIYRAINTLIRFTDKSHHNIETSLRRFMKRLIHPYKGEAALELKNASYRYDPHIHLLVASPAISFDEMCLNLPERLTVISKDLLYLERYKKELKSWNDVSRVRKYNSDQMTYDKNKGNLLLFSNLE